ncbi:MAG TPA: hypothetical protein VLB44_11005 [Kofleriaceae bacterium]|nr:hypothetical protein [Kofleriaceae bacterium]
MRWIWSLAIACIVAATGVHPDLGALRSLEGRDTRSGQLEAAPARVELVATRPQVHATRAHGTPSHELRLPASLAIEAAASTPRPLAHAASACPQLVSTLSRLVPATRSARGPPAAIA